MNEKMSVFDTNACPSANGQRFVTRAENICQKRGQVGPHGRHLLLLIFNDRTQKFGGLHKAINIFLVGGRLSKTHHLNQKIYLLIW